MKTEQIIKALKEKQATYVKRYGIKASIKVNKAFEREYDFTTDDFFAVINDETPFKLWNKGGSGWPSCSWISLKEDETQ